jgi:hypothetical protein
VTRAREDGVAATHSRNRGPPLAVKDDRAVTFPLAIDRPPQNLGAHRLGFLLWGWKRVLPGHTSKDRSIACINFGALCSAARNTGAPGCASAASTRSYSTAALRGPAATAARSAARRDRRSAAAAQRQSGGFSDVMGQDADIIDGPLTLGPYHGKLTIAPVSLPWRFVLRAEPRCWLTGLFFDLSPRKSGRRLF